MITQVPTQSMWCRAIVWLVAVALAGTVARADYVEASRHALVKASPSGEAATVATLERGDQLDLEATAQRFGYYQVHLPSGDRGWVYRTLVRRHAGSLPGVRPATGTLTATLNADRGTVYASDPVSVTPASTFRVLDKTYFRIGYSEQRADPLWTGYAIGKATDLTSHSRKRFATDTDTIIQITHDDYTNGEYSRGHMAPRLAISSRFGKPGNDATFVMSNVCPQFQDFNDGPWGNLEEWIAGKKTNKRFIKGWGDEYGKVWITVGPIFEGQVSIFADKIAVPTAFYCIVIDEEQGRPRALAFIMAHKDTRDSDLVGAMTTIDEIERRTGLDFFSELPDTIENSLEASKGTMLWPLSEAPN